MDIWRDLGITGNNASEHHCYEHAYLIVKSQSGITKQKFRFETIADETYSESSSIMNMDYTTRAKSIFTPFYWLNFVKGARVEFESGEQLIISNIKVINDSKSALNNGHGTKGVEITF